MREEGKQEVFEDQEKENKDLGVERGSGRREARKEKDHRAGARVDMKHPGSETSRPPTTVGLLPEH